MLRTRLLTAAVALPPLLAFVILAPAWSFSLFIGLCIIWGLYEIIDMASAPGPGVIATVAVVGGVPATIMLAGGIGLAWLAAAVSLSMCGLIALVASRLSPPHQHCANQSLPVGSSSPGHLPNNTSVRLAELAILVLGALYVGALFPYFALLRNMSGGARILILMMLVVMAGDSGAYFVGKPLGRIKLIAQVSPGKTVEGAAADLAFSLLAALVLNQVLGVGWKAGAAVAFGAAVSVIGQAGDLAESALKRMAGVKDSGWLIPGHGGLLDRTDSLVFAVVFTYYYSRWLGLAAA